MSGSESQQKWVIDSVIFNSIEFILVFLPVTVLGYYSLQHYGGETVTRLWLVISSLFFYGWWKLELLPLIVFSVCFNQVVGFNLGRHSTNHKLKSSLLIFGILCNLLLLAYYKYLDFIILNINLISGADTQLLNMALPLAISFFTFQQIAYLVDCRQNKVKHSGVLDYFLFVTFFPQLIAGPIVHHKEMLPQFRARFISPNYDAISRGLMLFSIGLFKKVVLADTFSIWAVNGFDRAQNLYFFEAWATSLSYTLQLYFDFSGYTDMALGAALLFGITLPQNFNSPYQAVNIQDFWQRWHITLSRFLRYYLYIPMGGGRLGMSNTTRNILLTFLLGGLWHGAGWTFILWGGLHGFGVIIHRIWSRTGLVMPVVLAWLLTLNFVNIGWVFFRANDWEGAIKVLRAMFSYSHHNNGWRLENLQGGPETILLLMVGFIIVIAFRNSNYIVKTFQQNIGFMFIKVILFYSSICFMMFENRMSEFLYFRF